MRHWVIGVLGIWVILAVFILTPGTTQTLVLAISGAAIAFLAFWLASHHEQSV
jgi:hypothetical protein